MPGLRGERPVGELLEPVQVVRGTCAIDMIPALNVATGRRALVGHGHGIPRLRKPMRLIRVDPR